MHFSRNRAPGANPLCRALGVACALAAGAALAEDFDSLLAEAVASHPTVEGRRSGLEAARAEREGAEWQQYPTPSFEFAARSSEVVGSGRNSGVLALEQPLYTGGRISAGIRAAGFREAAAEAAVVEAKQTTGLRVISTYTEALRQWQRQEYAKTSADEHERLLALIGRRVQQEVSPPADRDFAEARLAQAATELSLAGQGAQVALVQLGQLVGRPVAGVDPVRMEGKAIPATLDEAVARAVDASPVLARLDQTAQAAAEEVNLRRSVIMPQVAFRLERQVGSFPDAFNDNRAMLVLRAQPGAGLSAASAITAAQRRHDEARLAKEEARRSLRELVETAYAEWRAARERLRLVRQSTGMTQSVFESYSRQYVAGRKTWIDVLNAVREVSQSQYTLADAEALAQASALRLWLLAGDAPLGEPVREAGR